MAVEPTYLYHSFPRRRGQREIETGLLVLESMRDMGLVLAPESIVWWQPAVNGRMRKQVLLQRQISFTELAPTELPLHAKTFGGFALEFEIAVLRSFGAAPVFHIDKSSHAVWSTLVMQLLESRHLIKKLDELYGALERARRHDVPIHLINEDDEGSALEKHRSDWQSVGDLVRWLTYRTASPLDALGAGLDAVTNLFYPADDAKDDPTTSYYRRREWRIVANAVASGGNVLRKLKAHQANQLLSIDPDFYGNPASPRDKSKRVDECLLYPSFKGKRLIEYAKRAIVPRDALDKARALLAGTRAEVVALETVGTLQGP